MLNWNSTENETWWWVSDKNMMLNHTDVDGGKYDSIERTWMSYYAYGDERFIEGIKSCWTKIYRTNWLSKLLFGDYYYQGERYPGLTNTNMSRDHLIYTVSVLKLSGMSDSDLYEFVSHIRFRIGNTIGMLMTPDLWLWLRLITGKRIGLLYYPYEIIDMFINSLWNKLLINITGLGVEQTQDEFKMISNSDRPKILKFLTGLFFPNFAVKLMATQLSFLPNNWCCRQLKKLTLKMVQKNYVLQLLLDGPDISEEDINYYKPSNGDRWADILNPWMHNHNLSILDDKWLTFNVLDKDYLLKIYENKHKI